MVGNGTKQIDNFNLTHVVRNDTNKVHFDNITSFDFPDGKRGFILGGSLIGKITNVNLFTPALSMERMQALTEPEVGECGFSAEKVQVSKKITKQHLLIMLKAKRQHGIFMARLKQKRYG